MNIWVNGCFDIIHTGHIDLLWFAKEFRWKGNKLIVGLDSDDRVRSLKGDERPINNEKDRLKIMSSLKMVDEVVIFDNEKELINLIKAFKIDCMVVGDQYINKRVIGEEYSKFGVTYFPVNEISTTKIIEKIKKYVIN